MSAQFWETKANDAIGWCTDEQRSAARATVARHAADPDDDMLLCSMLGLTVGES